MPSIAQRLGEQIRRMFTERAFERSWQHAIGLAVVTAVAYFLAARVGLTLLKPEGVAVMWPALGLAVGCLIALGSDAWAPVATGIFVGIIAARLRVGGSFWIAIALGLCNSCFKHKSIHIVRRDIENLIKLSQRFRETPQIDIRKRVLGEEGKVARVEPLGFLKIPFAPLQLAPPPFYIGQRLRNTAAIWQELTCLFKVTHCGVVIL